MPNKSDGEAGGGTKHLSWRKVLWNQAKSLGETMRHVGTTFKELPLGIANYQHNECNWQSTRWQKFATTKYVQLAHHTTRQQKFSVLNLGKQLAFKNEMPSAAITCTASCKSSMTGSGRLTRTTSSTLYLQHNQSPPTSSLHDDARQAGRSFSTPEPHTCDHERDLNCQ